LKQQKKNKPTKTQYKPEHIRGIQMHHLLATKMSLHLQEKNLVKVNKQANSNL